jgi:hypothetical protein
MAFHYSPKIVTDGLVYYIDGPNPKSYSGSGTSSYDLISGRLAQLKNGVTWTSPYFGFDGTDDFIDCGGVDITSGQELSIDIFLKLGSSQVAYADILDYDHAGYGFVIQQYYPLGAGDWYFAWYTSGYQFLFMTLPTLTDFQFTLTFNSGTVKYYIDGVYQSSTTGGNITATGKNMKIGDFVGGGRNLNGSISSVKIYNKELTADEIRSNFLAHKKRYGL